MLGVGYRCQFEPNNLECVRLAREKVLGDVKIIDANFGFAIGDPNQWRLKRDAGRRRRAHGRRHLLPADHAHAHRRRSDLDQRRRGQDRRRQVQGSRRNHPVASEVPRAAWSPIACAPTRPTASQGFRAATTRGWFGLDPAYYYSGNRGRRSDDTEINIPGGDQFALELDDFADCIINKKPTQVPGEMGVRT